MFVPVQIAFNTERFPANLALVLLFPGVGRQMAVQLSFPPEFSGAVGAFVREGIHVDLAMNAQRRHRLKSFPASVANVRAFPGMSPPVIVPNGSLRESFPAQIAQPIPPPFVYVPNVPDQGSFFLQRFPANVTNEKAQRIMGPLMSLVQFLARETFITFITLIIFDKVRPRFLFYYWFLFYY